MTSAAVPKWRVFQLVVLIYYHVCSTTEQMQNYGYLGQIFAAKATFKIAFMKMQSRADFEKRYFDDVALAVCMAGLCLSASSGLTSISHVCPRETNKDFDESKDEALYNDYFPD